MKKASIVSIGNEILSGLTVDTNAAYLSRKLLSIGIPVVSSYTVGDDIDLIVRSLKRAADDGDVILVTGGLGPTDDDLTRQAFAKFLDCQLQLDEKVLERIEDFFTKRNLEMPEKNKVQAYTPAGSISIPNNLGTAPGIMAKSKGKILVAMPGVPSEMKQMFEESVFDQLKQLADGQFVVVKKLKCFGTGESNIAGMIGDIMQRGRNPLVNCTASSGDITLHIIATAKNEKTANEMIEKDEKVLREILGEFVYGTDDQTLAGVVAEKLISNKKTIAVAESCTGGLLGKLLTDIPGSSDYFLQSWVTYSNKSKIKELGVDAELIEKEGAVSSKVAQAMAEGAKKNSASDLAIAITGIAGPTGETSEKPLGLVYICLTSDIGADAEPKSITEKFVFPGSRAYVRGRAALTALNILRLSL